ncbi:hypothetical protein [Mechercharimyces sp. CAU 1602]|uniref:hypothetical protein n=1 Tax=Mechercharimyces sp. CAU 1602 TaxID=2973933 RepID=UPI0021614129|nr:hypothetical protein [Mechercharimyces sp. CAU 1602]
MLDLEPELLEWVERKKLEESLARGQAISRNQFIAEALEQYKVHLDVKEEK